MSGASFQEPGGPVFDRNVEQAAASSAVPAGGSGMGRLFSGGYCGASAVALLLFFLPWVKVSCMDAEVVSQSGLQIMLGKVTENPDFEKDLEKMGGGNLGNELFKNMPDFKLKTPDLRQPFRFGRDKNGPDGLKLAQFGDGFPLGGRNKAPDRAKFAKMKGDVDQFYPLAILPIGLLIAVLAGIVSVAVGNSSGISIAGVCGTALASLGAFLCIVVKLPIQKSLGQLPGMPFEFAHTLFFWLMFVLVVLALSLAIASLAIANNAPRPRAVDPYA